MKFMGLGASGDGGGFGTLSSAGCLMGNLAREILAQRGGRPP